MFVRMDGHFSASRIVKSLRFLDLEDPRPDVLDGLAHLGAGFVVSLTAMVVRSRTVIPAERFPG